MCICCLLLGAATGKIKLGRSPTAVAPLGLVPAPQPYPVMTPPLDPSVLPAMLHQTAHPPYGETGGVGLSTLTEEDEQAMRTELEENRALISQLQASVEQKLHDRDASQPPTQPPTVPPTPLASRPLPARLPLPPISDGPAVGPPLSELPSPWQGAPYYAGPVGYGAGYGAAAIGTCYCGCNGGVPPTSQPMSPLR